MSNDPKKEIDLDSESFFPMFTRGQMLSNLDGIQFAVTETPRQRNGMVYHFRSYGLDDDHLIHELPQHEMEDGRFISQNPKVHFSERLSAGTTGNKGERMNNKRLCDSNMAENEHQAGVVDLPALVRPWDWIEANPCKALRMVGISFREQDEAEDLRVHVVAEDPRYPTMCVNGDLNFGVSINAETGMPEGGRVCICAARADDFCICDLGTNDQS